MACCSSSPDTAPEAPSCRRRARSLCAAARSVSRTCTSACSCAVVANRLRTSRTVRASCASAWSSATLRVGLIQPHQGLSGFDELRVVGTDRDDGAGDLRGDLHHVAADVGVIGGLVVAQHLRPVQPYRQARRAAQRAAGAGASAAASALRRSYAWSLACLAVLMTILEKQILVKPRGASSSGRSRACGQASPPARALPSW